MKRGIAIFAVTVVGWFVIVALYGYWYISDGVAHPEALKRVPVDMEALALDRDPLMQLVSFAIFRFPFLFVALVVVLLVEVKLLSDRCKNHAGADRAMV